MSYKDFILTKISKDFVHNLTTQLPSLCNNEQQLMERYANTSTIECLKHENKKICLRDYSKYNNSFNLMMDIEGNDFQQAVEISKSLNNYLGSLEYTITQDTYFEKLLDQYQRDLSNRNNSTDVINKTLQYIVTPPDFSCINLDKDAVSGFTTPEDIYMNANGKGGVIAREIERVYELYKDNMIDELDFYRDVGRVTVGGVNFQGIEAERIPTNIYTNYEYFKLLPVLDKLIKTKSGTQHPRHSIAHLLFCITSIIKKKHRCYYNYYTPQTLQKYTTIIGNILTKISKKDKSELTLYYKTFHLLSLKKIYELLKVVVEQRRRVVDVSESSTEVQYRFRLLDLLRPYLDTITESKTYNSLDTLSFNLNSNDEIDTFHFRLSINGVYRPLLIGIERIDMLDIEDDSYIEVNILGISIFIENLKLFTKRRNGIKIEILINHTILLIYKK